MSSRLEIDAIDTFYGQSQALFGVSIEVAAGEVVYVLGRNGAGKTTTMKSAMGLLKPARGAVRLGGRALLKMEPDRIAHLGLGYVPEERRIFPGLTVIENLEVASKPAPGGRQGWSLQSVFDLFPVLQAYGRRRASLMSGGEQQMLAIGRALMGNPSILLLDEPMEGLAPLIVQAVEDRIKDMGESGIGVLVSDSKVRSALRNGQRVYVMERGSVVFADSVDALARAGDKVQSWLSV